MVLSCSPITYSRCIEIKKTNCVHIFLWKKYGRYKHNLQKGGDKLSRYFGFNKRNIVENVALVTSSNDVLLLYQFQNVKENNLNPIT